MQISSHFFFYSQSESTDRLFDFFILTRIKIFDIALVPLHRSLFNTRYRTGRIFWSVHHSDKMKEKFEEIDQVKLTLSQTNIREVSPSNRRRKEKIFTKKPSVLSLVWFSLLNVSSNKRLFNSFTQIIDLHFHWTQTHAQQSISDLSSRKTIEFFQNRDSRMELEVKAEKPEPWKNDKRVDASNSTVERQWRWKNVDLSVRWESKTKDKQKTECFSLLFVRNCIKAKNCHWIFSWSTMIFSLLIRFQSKSLLTPNDKISFQASS